MLSAYDFWHSPLYWYFLVGTLAISVLAFFVFAIPLTWLAEKGGARVERWRIQRASDKQRALRVPGALSCLGNNAFTLAVMTAAWPLVRHSPIRLEGWPSWYEVVGQLILFIYLDDFLYYWVHRAMHAPALYKRIHFRHHRIVTPTAISGLIMHPLEYLTTASVALIGPMLLGSHLVTVWLWAIFRQWEAAEGHCGLDLRYSPTHFLPGGDGARHHDFHHAKVRGNYAGMLAIWDRVFNTLSKNYAPSRRG